ncbi:MAG: serine/threonine protein kinase, partial [Planctomycetes bacterium]|nr:serine/threonine protein kinase [Planctomycetota bacterium]
MKICLGCEGVTQAASVRCNTCGAWLVPTEDVHYPTRRGEGEGGNPFLGSVIDGKYRLQTVLGRGGLGTVFGAQHTGSLLPVALKLLHPRFAEQREYRSALLTEARRAASVMHERCARLLDVGETDDGVAYLAMELVDGDTLEEIVRSGPLPPGHAVEILAQVVEALVAIHGAGMVHCDLSPRNVMVAARDGRLRVKVLDFGIARTISMTGGERTAQNDLTGFFNPVFSAPEVLVGTGVDARADFYSLGMLARLLLTGVLPGGQQGAERTVAFPRGVPRRLARLVQRCLSRDPKERPSSARWIDRELAIVRGAHRPPAQRLALASLAVAVIANLLGNEPGPAPFLRTRAGNNLELVAPGVASVVQCKTGHQLDTMSFYFGGFSADDLSLEISRQGLRLLRLELHPEVETSGDALVLATAQPAWQQALTAIAKSSAEGPVDISFVVPGAGSLGDARVRIDDEPPQLQWQLNPAADGDHELTSRTVLTWRANDNVEVASVRVEVALPKGGPQGFDLDGATGEFALGEALAARAPEVAPLGPIEVHVVAVDTAGLRSNVEPLRVAAADFAAPFVAEVTGPGGESYVPCLSGRARLRLQLSAFERD